MNQINKMCTRIHIMCAQITKRSSQITWFLCGWTGKQAKSKEYLLYLCPKPKPTCTDSQQRQQGGTSALNVATFNINMKEWMTKTQVYLAANTAFCRSQQVKSKGHK